MDHQIILFFFSQDFKYLIFLYIYVWHSILDLLLQKIPAAAGKLQRNPDVDWCYKTTTQTQSCKMTDNQAACWPRGKVLGGSSSINYMVRRASSVKQAVECVVIVHLLQCITPLVFFTLFFLVA